MMYYTEEEAGNTILSAARFLLENRLIARTWGNISARISETEFLITPSGMAYETLGREDLVKVKIQDLSYEGKHKPSSEKGIHAAVYALHEDAAFTVHTHQDYATALGCDGKNYPFAPCIAYGLPGTKKLSENVKMAIFIHIREKTFLMRRHGVLCFGKDTEEVYQRLLSLEERCREEFLKLSKAAEPPYEKRAYVDDFAQIAGPFVPDLSRVKTDDPEALTMIARKNALAAACSKEGPLPYADALLQHTVYRLKYSRLKDQ